MKRESLIVQPFSRVAIFAAMACSLASQLAFAQNGTMPKTAPDRHLRLSRPVTPAQSNTFKSPGAQTDNAVGGGNATDTGFQTSAPATTVSLTGAVTRLDAGAADADGQRRPIQGHIQGEQRMPFQGRVESMIDTPLTPQKPRSEKVLPETFRGWLEKAHPQFALNASQNAPDSVVCIKGQWDDSSKTLDKFQIPHVKISGGKLATYPLFNTKVVIVDCAGDLPAAARQKLRDFVSRGGYVLSTDWALDRFTSKTFDNYIVWNNGQNRRDIVDATAVDTDPVVFNNAVSNAYWKLDQDSHLIHINNRERVRVLAQSKQLIADDPDRAGILAVLFPFGRGYVMHMTGHFDNNSKLAIGHFLPDPAPVIKISLRQAIAANFVVAGLTQTRIATGMNR